MSLPKAPTTDASISGATLDQFLGGRISVLQPEQGHRAGSDAVWLAASIEAQAGERVLDVGAGVGVAGLCLLARIPELEVTAVEMDGRLCALAASNAARNAVADKFKIIEADIAAPAELLAAKGLIRESYDHAIANPPFHIEGTVRAAPDERRAFAHVMGDGALEDWVRFLASMATPKGWLTLIHRPDSLTMLLKLLERRFGDVIVFPLFPRAAAAATRIILRARKGSRRRGVVLLPGLVLHAADGRYTPRAEAVLREGEALRFDL